MEQINTMLLLSKQRSGSERWLVAWILLELRQVLGYKAEISNQLIIDLGLGQGSKIEVLGGNWPNEQCWGRGGDPRADCFSTPGALIIPC